MAAGKKKAAAKKSPKKTKAAKKAPSKVSPAKAKPTVKKPGAAKKPAVKKAAGATATVKIPKKPAVIQPVQTASAPVTAPAIVPPPPAAPRPATQIDPNPGLGCPQCGFRIPISIQMLLSGQAINCPACRLELRVNREESKETLNALEKVAEAIAKTDEAKRGFQ